MKSLLLGVATALFVWGSTGCSAVKPDWLYGNKKSPSVVQSNLAAPDSYEVRTAELPEPTPAPAVTPKPTKPPVSVPSKFVHYRDKVIVLMYHHIAESEAGEEITITPAKFKSHLKLLQDHHYQVISMEEYAGYIINGAPVPPNAVVITFDDGYESYYKYGYPILKEFGYTATNFLIVSYVGSKNSSLPFMNWEQVIQMKNDGFSFYSHTYNAHEKRKGDKNQLVPSLGNRIWLDDYNRLETEEEYIKRVKEDLSHANQVLREKLGNEWNILCFPYGFFTKTLLEAGKEIGIDFFFTTKDGINTNQDKEIFRVHAGTRYMTPERLLYKLNKFNQPAPSAKK